MIYQYIQALKIAPLPEANEFSSWLDHWRSCAQQKYDPPHPSLLLQALGDPANKVETSALDRNVELNFAHQPVPLFRKTREKWCLVRQRE